MRGNGAWWTIGSSGPNPARCLIFEFVSDSAPIVRPWNPPSKAMIPGRWVWYRASLMAPSTASVPELVRKTRAFSLNGAMAARRSMNSM